MHKTHRVVITGLGAVTPLGTNAKSSFEALRKGVVKVQKIKGIEQFKEFKCHIGAPIHEDFDQHKYETSMGTSLLFSVGNAMVIEALEDAGVLDPQNDAIDRDHFGISLATVVGESLDEENSNPNKRDFFRTYKFTLPSALAFAHQLRGSQDVSQ